MVVAIGYGLGPLITGIVSEALDIEPVTPAV